MKNGFHAPKIILYMDIDLLSKMVKELILDNDRVVLPGLGAFVAEIVPSTFSDKGYTINPPYRRMYFRSKPDEGSELAELYVKGNNVDTAMAERIIRDFVAELKSILHTRKTVVFPGLGRLRATKENNIFFVADEDLDIYPAGFGLEPISLKTHQETKEEVTAAVEGLKSMLIEPGTPQEPEILPEPETEVLPGPDTEVLTESGISYEQEILPEPEALPEMKPTEEARKVEVPTVPNDASAAFRKTAILGKTAEKDVFVRHEAHPAGSGGIVAEPVAVTASESKPVPQRKVNVMKIILIVFGIMSALALLSLAALAIAGRTCPEWIDRFLYTPEELRILNHIL